MQRLLPHLVARAADIVAGLEQLASYLGVPEHRVRFWRNGTATAPNHIVALLVDLILKDDVARAEQDRRRAPRPVAVIAASTTADSSENAHRAPSAR